MRFWVFTVNWAILQHYLSFHSARQQVAAWAACWWLSAHLCLADTKKLTVNQLTLHFLGRHEWEIKIGSVCCTYKAPRTNMSSSVALHRPRFAQTHQTTPRVSHCSSAALTTARLDIFSSLQFIYQSSDRKDSSLTFPTAVTHRYSHQTKRGKQLLPLHNNKLFVSALFSTMKTDFKQYMTEINWLLILALLALIKQSWWKMHQPAMLS